MMSLRRFAVIAPFQFQHNKHNTSSVVSSSAADVITSKNAQEQSVDATTATKTNVDIKNTPIVTTATKSHRIIDEDDYADESSDNSSETFYTNIINTNAAGNGLQTIRASFGLSGLIGHSPGGINSGGNIGGGHQTYPHTINGNANLLLCGAMLSVVTTILCVVCYCCHRNIKKRTEAAYRQQQQWLESDPNMEIYSVEQSYETSGIFLGESSDGFTTLATLHHEPPPSYDAVVAMQEQQLLQQQLYQQQCHLLQQQQQQQTLLQHNSPPPGYRSTLAINETTTPTMSASAAASNIAMDTLNNDSNGNLSGSCNISISGNSIGGNSCSNFFACGKPNAASGRYANGSNNNSNSNTAFLNMKKALNAQSCCSLQRAEVENMWNAAAAAVAVRATHATSSPCGAANHSGNNAASSSSSSSSGSSSGNASNNNRTYISPNILSRKSLPLTLPAKFTAKASRGRRYLPHHSTYYRRGCPLCGKFRYDADESLTLSVESGLDVSATNAAGALDAGVTQEAVGEERGSSSTESKLSDSCQQLNAMDDVALSKSNEAVNNATREQSVTMTTHTNALDEDEFQKCACAVNILESSSTIIIDSDSNGNSNNNNNNMMLTSTDNNANVESSEPTIDQNTNGQTMIEEEEVAAGVAQVTKNANCVAVNAITPSTTIEHSHCTDVVVSPIRAEETTLDAINANSGIIRVDMSKIIDQTGLPTYEAAAKLESSGYV